MTTEYPTRLEIEAELRSLIEAGQKDVGLYDSTIGWLGFVVVTKTNDRLSFQWFDSATSVPSVRKIRDGFTAEG